MLRNAKIRLGLSSLLLTVCLVLVVTAWGDSRTDERTLAAVEDVVHGLVEPEQMHLVADALITAGANDLLGAPSWTTTARYEYWQDGERFRISTRVEDPRTPLTEDMDVSWDGRTFYLWLRQSDVLSLRTELPDQLPVALPHPLMLAIGPFSSSRQSCAGCLWIPASLKARRPSSDSLLSASSLRPTSGLARSLLFDPEPSVLRVEVATDPTRQRAFRDEVKLVRERGRWLVDQIQRFDDSGQLQSVLRFDRFQSADGGATGRLYPRIIDLKVVAAPTVPAALRSTFAVKELSVNTPVDPVVFDLTQEQPKTIWDSDSEIFLR